MKLVWMMAAAATGLIACGEGPSGEAEERAILEELTPEERGEVASEGVNAAADDEDPDVIAVPSTVIVRVITFFGELVYYSTPGEQSDVPGTPPASAPRVMSKQSSRPGSSGIAYGMLGERSPLDEYLTVTPASAPVPRALLNSEPPGPVRDRALQRTIVATMSAPVTALPQAQLASVTVQLGNVNQWCQGGSSASFAADVCTITNWDVDFCHNGTWYSVTDQVGSSNKRRNSLSWTLACGANGRVRHYYRAGAFWYKVVDEAIPSNTLDGWQYEGDWALRRKITHNRTASGFVRASSHFNVPF